MTNIIKVQFFKGGTPAGKAYSYYTPEPVDVGDIVDIKAQFTMDGGRLVTLRKVFHENYKKKRGSATDEFSGHSVDFFIDGIPVKEKEYTATLLGFCGGAEQMKMLTMPHYFPEDMPWEARRKILLEVCGDVADTEVIASNGELMELPSYLLMPGTDSSSAIRWRTGAIFR